MKSNLPIDCVIAITYKCNSRCTMCDIWKIKNHNDVSPAEYEKLPYTLRDVNISGGEPFLRPDLPEIIQVIKKNNPYARVVISSNGFATSLIERTMIEILKINKNVGVAISIDGIGEMHNTMRGIPGGFDKAVATVEMLKKIGVKTIRLGFTVTEENVEHLTRVYDLANKLGIQFTHSFAQSSEFYFGGKQNVHTPNREKLDLQYDYLIKKELSSWNLKKWARAYFSYGMYKFITSKNPVLSNAPGRDFFFLDPSGVIYPSVVHNVKMGNIQDIEKGKFEDFWCSEETEVKRKEIDNLKIPVWMICTARTAIKKHPLRVGMWVIKNKFF